MVSIDDESGKRHDDVMIMFMGVHIRVCTRGFNVYRDRLDVEIRWCMYIKNVQIKIIH